MNQNLQELREKFTQLQQLANMDIHNWEPSTKPGIEGRKNKAKAEIEEVSPKLVRAILSNSQTFLVTRDFEGTGEVVKEAAKNAETTILLDFLSTEKWMFSQIFDKKVTNFTFNSDTINKINVLLFDIGNRLDVMSMPSVDVNARRFGTLKSREEMIERIEEALIFAFNDELKKSIIQLDLKEAVLKKLNLDSVTVIIINVLPEFTDPLKGLSAKTTVLSNDNQNLALLAATKTRQSDSITTKSVKVLSKPEPEVLSRSEEKRLSSVQNYPGKRRGPKPKNKVVVSEVSTISVAEEPAIRQITVEDTQN